MVKQAQIGGVVALIHMLENALKKWVSERVDQLFRAKVRHIMAMISDVQAKIIELESLILEERQEVSDAIEDFAKRLKEALDAAANSGQDLTVLITDLERVADEVRAIYVKPDV